MWLQGMMNVPEEEDVRAAFLRHDGIEDAEVCAVHPGSWLQAYLS